MSVFSAAGGDELGASSFRNDLRGEVRIYLGKPWCSNYHTVCVSVCESLVGQIKLIQQ